MKKKAEPHKTVLIISIGFLLVYVFTKGNWALAVSLTVGVLGSLSDYMCEKIDFVWMKLAWLLGMIIPNILLTVIFFFFLFPIALLSRLFTKKDPLRLKNINTSLFKDRNKAFDKTSFEKPW
jgi:hypothetical protein